MVKCLNIGKPIYQSISTYNVPFPFVLPGMFPGKESDERFEGHLERLRSLICKRTAVYATEEKALRVMLEGEQEEERKRDREKRQKKEREVLMQKKREVDAMLFGGNLVPPKR